MKIAILTCKVAVFMKISQNKSFHVKMQVFQFSHEMKKKLSKLKDKSESSINFFNVVHLD